MKKYNVIVIFDKNMKNTLMCKRTKEPYIGMYNLVGGKIEKENDGLNEAYRELYEETAITKEDVSLKYFMNIEYVSFGKDLEIYYGILNNDVKLVEEVNKLEWVDINDNFFDLNKYAGEGNIGHIIEEIKIDIEDYIKLNKMKQWSDIDVKTYILELEDLVSNLFITLMGNNCGEDELSYKQIEAFGNMICDQAKKIV